MKHFESACKQLGVTPVVLDDLTTDNLASANISKIANAIEPYVKWADLVLTHWKGDTHHAHHAIVDAVELATRPFRNAKSVFCFEIATSTDQGFENNFDPNCYVYLDETDMRNKCLAMEHYVSEIFPGRTPADLECQMRYRGSQCGSELAEAYVVARFFIK